MYSAVGIVGCGPPQPLFEHFETEWRHSGDTRSQNRCQIRLLSRQSQQSAAVVPAHLQSLPEFLVRHVQVALRLLHARVSEHQLNDPDVDAIREESTRAFVPQVVPVEVDSLQLLSVPCCSRACWLRLDAVREKP